MCRYGATTHVVAVVLHRESMCLTCTCTPLSLSTHFPFTVLSQTSQTMRSKGRLWPSCGRWVHGTVCLHAVQDILDLSQTVLVTKPANHGCVLTISSATIHLSACNLVGTFSGSLLFVISECSSWRLTLHDWSAYC